MLAPDAEHFFQSDRDIELAKIRSDKRTTIGKTAGDPVEIPSKVMDMVFLSIDNACEKVLTAESGHITRLLDLSTGKTIATYRGHTGPVTSVCVSYSAAKLPLHLYTGSWDKTIISYCLATHKPLLTFKSHSDFVKKVRYVAPHLYSCSADSTIIKWNAETAKVLMVYKGHTRGVEDVRVEPVGDSLCMFSCSSDTSIRQWDVETGKQLRLFEGHLTGVYQLLIDDEDLWSVSADKTAKRWEIATGLCNDTIPHADFVKCCVLVGGWIVTGGRDENLRVYDVGSGELLYTIRGHYGEINSLRVRGNTLYSAGLDGTIRRWSLLDLEKLNEAAEEVEVIVEEVVDPVKVNMMTEEEEQELRDLMDN